jgi:H+/gluconate symporter-like permease
MMGLVVAIVPATLGLVFGAWIDRVMPVPMRPIGAQVEIPSLSDAQLPSLWLSLLPVALPVLLISTNTVLKVYADAEPTAVLRAEDVQFDKLQTQLSAQLASSEPTPGKVIVAAWPEELRSSLDAGHVLTQAQEAAMLAELNKLLKSKKFYNDELFFGISLNPVAKSLDKKAIERLGQADLMRLNRALLESLFPSAIAEHVWETPRRQAADWSSLFGNANLALLISALIAMGTMAATRNLSRVDVAVAVEDSLMSGGVIILITAAGGAFGEMLKVAKVGQEIEKMCAGVGSGSSAGLMLLLLAFGVAAVFKVAQGSTTVSMITTSGMLASLASVEILGFHPVYLATAIGCGGLMGSWMNDSGFWVFAKMGGLTEAEALKSWTILLVIMSLAGLAVTLILATLLPLKGAA